MDKEKIDIYVEITSHCNFHCEFCPSDVMKRDKEHLCFEDGKKFIIDVSKKYDIRLIQFNVLGEPALNPDISRYLDLCDELGLPLYLISNASTLLQNRPLLEKIFSYKSNIILVLSLQSINALDYQARHFAGMTYEQYLDCIFTITEQKFLHKSRCSLDIHVSSSYLYQTFNNFYTDSAVNIYTRSDYKKTFPEFLKSFTDRVKRLKEKLHSHTSSPQFLSFYQSVYQNDHTFFDTASIPEDIWKLEGGSSYMFLPDCHLTIKQFGFWTKEKAFIKRALEETNPDKFIYIDKKLGSEPCSMANNIGLLSNGDIITCCLDYEGEMNLGNIKNTSIDSEEFLQKQKSITENPLQYEICQRCKGHMYIFDKSPLAANIQKIEAYSWDWHDKENDMWGKEGRWSKELSTVFLYSRINGNLLSMNAMAPAKREGEENNQGWYRLKIHQYHPETDLFSEQMSAVFCCPENEISHIELKAEFTYGCFYKIEIITPTFCPGDRYHTTDNRFLGLAVFDISIESRKE